MNRGNQQERPKQSIVKQIKPSLAWYFAGFVDGEGSFNVSLRRKPDYKLGWQPILSFNVSQKERTILALMKRHFGCGILKQRKDGLYSYDVTNPRMIYQVIIPFFETYRFLSQTKKRNFSLFKRIAKIMIDKQHLEPEGFKRLLELRKQLNQGKGRKRKYTMENVLESSETIRRGLK